MKRFILDACIDLDSDNKQHISNFFSDLWVEKNKFKIVVGGSKLAKEYNPKFIRILAQLTRAQKIERRQDTVVDALETSIIDRFHSKFVTMPSECDDHHIFALSLESGCKTVLTKDLRMGKCIKKCRNTVGHTNCPKLKLYSHD